MDNYDNDIERDGIMWEIQGLVTRHFLLDERLRWEKDGGTRELNN